MAISAIASPGFHAASQVQSATQHKHGGRHGHALVDIDAAGSSLASAPSATGKTASKLNIVA